MNRRIERNYLEINSLEELNEHRFETSAYAIKIIEPVDFQLNKFFYKNVGKKHHWIDRLTWEDKQWIEYTSSNNLKTYILKKNNDLAGFFELLFHPEKNEVEIAYLGLLEDYHNQQLGSYLLSTAIKNSFLKNPKRVWVHTCTLDHKNALNNYLSRGMKIFKKESVTI